ncbi:MAG: hypothetical protein VKJ06_01210, partial [Vampirovibrionales bacterium]|nr:hypothetical protein [Vampirovibrionales bacterium]
MPFTMPLAQTPEISLSKDASQPPVLDAPVEVLAQAPLPDAFNPREIFEPNGFYGHAMALKRWAGVSANLPLPAIIQHGIYFYQGDFVSGGEAQALLPVCWVPTPQRASVYARVCKRPAMAIGAPFLYALAYWQNRLKHLTTDPISNALNAPRGTLVFPAHSTRYIQAEFDHKRLAQTLAQLSKAYNPIRVSLFWKEIEAGAHQSYQQAGLEVVCNGHQFDPAFIDRLCLNLLRHARVLTTGIGSHVPYAIASGRPVYRLEDFEASYHELKPGTLIDDAQAGRLNFAAQTFAQLFAPWDACNKRDTISQAQQAWAQSYTGAPWLKTTDELKTLFKLAQHQDAFWPAHWV